MMLWSGEHILLFFRLPNEKGITYWKHNNLSKNAKNESVIYKIVNKLKKDKYCEKNKAVLFYDLLFVIYPFILSFPIRMIKVLKYGHLSPLSKKKLNHKNN